MTSYDYVFDLEELNSELDNSKYVDVIGWDDVGDVSMHEDLAWFETQDLVCRDTGVCTTYP